MEELLMELWGDAYTPEIFSFFMTIFLLLILVAFIKMLLVIIFRF